MRHALALNEDRMNYEPEFVFPEWSQISPQVGIIIQAWFVGAHIDIGGSSTHDGLSLYPLQWILLESHLKGLVLEFDGSFGKPTMEDLIKLVLPLGLKVTRHESLRLYKIANGIEVNMQDYPASPRRWQFPSSPQAFAE